MTKEKVDYYAGKTMARASKSVLKPWVATLSLQAQGTLLTAVRGPDGMPKEDKAKILVRALRATIMNNAKTLGIDDIFMGDGSGLTSFDVVRDFFKDKDQYPHHWMTHFMHSAEIIGYHHPNPNVAAFWQKVYFAFCEDIHVEPEPRETMNHRLFRDGNQEQVKEKCTICGFDMIIPTPVVRCANCLIGRF